MAVTPLVDFGDTLVDERFTGAWPQPAPA